MLRNRIIPILLLQDGGLVKTQQFKKPVYVGDPINAVRIFNEKEVDELALLDISRARNRNEPDYELIRDIVSEAFMPIAYGGGIESEKQIEKLFRIGIEKVILSTVTIKNPDFISKAASVSGSQSIVVCIDYFKRKIFGDGLLINGNKTWKSIDVFDHSKKMEDLGAGELIITNVNCEGMMKGYDIPLIEKISNELSIPVIANGGASSIDDLALAIKAGASAAAAGSIFVFQGKHKAVLITYPKYTDIQAKFNSK